MEQINRILECVQKTNPGMDKERLIEELSVCRYSAIVLNVICENDRNSACKN